MGKKWLKFKQDVAEIENMLVRKYPKAFFPKGSKDTKPLAIGVRMALVIDNPDVEWKLISMAVGNYVKKNRYLQAIAAATERVNLDGSFSSSVTENQRNFAISELSERQSNRLSKEAA